MKICLVHHGKSTYVAAKLEEAGIEFVAPEQAEIMLINSDHPGWYQRPIAAQATRRGTRVCLIPHGGPPMLDYDGLRPADFPIWIDFVHGEGHAEIYRRIGYPRRVEVVGWSYGPLAAAEVKQALTQAAPLTDLGALRDSSEMGVEPAGKTLAYTPRSVLFTPIHPWTSDPSGQSILPVHREANREAYEALLASETPSKTVRLWGADEPNGIDERDPAVIYEQSDLGLVDFTPYDAVLGYGTPMYSALAAGKTLVSFGQDLAPMDDQGTKIAAHWLEYKDYMRYPFDIADGRPLDELLADADGHRDVRQWVKEFVGGPFDARHMVNCLESILPNRATRRALARA